MTTGIIIIIISASTRTSTRSSTNKRTKQTHNNHPYHCYHHHLHPHYHPSPFLPQAGELACASTLCATSSYHSGSAARCHSRNDSASTSESAYSG
eukprot:6194708-Pleurochrysis_carterae.AAC.2